MKIILIHQIKNVLVVQQYYFVLNAQVQVYVPNVILLNFYKLLRPPVKMIVQVI